MSDKAEILKGEIAQTRESLETKIASLENQVTDTVDNVVQTVTDTANKLRPSEQVRNHPFGAVGIAAATGLVFGVWVRGVGTRRSIPSYQRAPSPEFQAVKRVGITFLLRKGAELLKKQSPQMAASVEEVENNIIESLTDSWRPAGA